MIKINEFKRLDWVCVSWAIATACLWFAVVGGGFSYTILQIFGG